MDTPSHVELLWRRLKDAEDADARDHLVVHYAPLVKYVAGRLRAGLPSSVDQDDLISDGVIGLMDAIDKFDLDRGLQFQTYAVPRVRGAIIDGLRTSDWVPRAVREKLRDINAATATLESRLQRRPSESELARELGISAHELQKIYGQGSYASIGSLDLNDTAEHIAPRATEGLPGADDGLPAGFLRAVRGLLERDQVVIALYYWERLSLAEIGQVLQVSESRVSQLLTRATQELRRRLLD